METKKRETLDKFAINITTQVMNGDVDKVYGREKEFDDLCKILLRKKKNNAVLIGFTGVGKSVIVYLLAKRILEGKIALGLANKVIYSIDAASITAGTQYRGQMEERLKKLLQECEEDDDIILFIDEIHTILDSGGSNSMNIANIMKPHLTSGKLQVIGATTFDEYKKFFEKDAALSRRFNKVTIDEPTISECVEILRNCVNSYEDYHNVKFPEELLKEIPVFAKKFIKDRYLPDSAVDIIDELGAKIKMEKTKPNSKLMKLYDEMEEVQLKKAELIKHSKWDEIAFFKPNIYDKCQEKIKSEQTSFINKIKTSEKTIITEKDVLSVVAKISKIPLDTLNQDGKSNLRKLEETLNKEFINQDDAKNKVIKTLKKSVMGFSNPNKPVSFLFLGLTGSGKTYLAKLISKIWFNDSLIRIDMSEYQEKISSTALAGSPPGYVGYDEGGSLTEQVKRQPYSVVLLDEIEKADKTILNNFLQVLDDGHLTDGKGKKVDFKNTIIIMTSNLGAKDSEYIKVGYTSEKEETKLINTSIDAARKHFTPEFWNRIDDVVVFNQLQKDDMFKILELELNNVKDMLKSKNIKITFSKKIKDVLSEKGYDPKLGARPLKRVVDKMIVDEVTDYLFNLEVQPTKLNVDWDEKTEKVVVE